MRVPTPSAAAELVVPVKADLRIALDDLGRQLYRATRQTVELKRLQLSTARKRLKDPKTSVQDYRMRIDDLHFRLQNNLRRHLKLKRERLQWRAASLARSTPANRCRILNTELEELYNNLNKNMNNYININTKKLRETTTALSLLNPKAILSRGYSITRTIPDKKIVRAARTLDPGQMLEILLAEGELNVQVN